LADPTNPVVTIILTTYRRPKLLKGAIESVLRQSYPHFEIRVYDDCSGDETEEVVEKFKAQDDRIFFHSHAKNLGWFLDNVNYGISRVQTPLWTVLSDDNVFLPGFLEKAVQTLKQFPEAMFACRQVIFITEDKKIHTVSPGNNWRSGLHHPDEGLSACIRDPSIFGGAIYRREAIEQVGLLDAETAEVSDWDYIFRTVSRFPFAVDLEPGVVFRRDLSSFSGASEAKFTWPYWLKMLKNLQDGPCPESAEKLLKKRLRRMLIQQAEISSRIGHFKDSLSAAKTLQYFFNDWPQAMRLICLARFCQYFPSLREKLLKKNSERSKNKLERNTRALSELLKYADYLEPTPTSGITDSD
jgi:glycosyltransferase involved in cell wall biosynthesis